MDIFPFLFSEYSNTAIHCIQVVLILEDFQLVHPSFLELINSVLSAGEVPGLYAVEELDSLLSPLRDMASDEGHTGPLYSYFAKRKFFFFFFGIQEV